MLTTAPAVPEDEYFLLSNLSPGRTQKRLALAIVFSLLVVLYLVTGPLSGIKLGEINAFVASYAAAMFTIDSITAILLFAQFSILRSRAILVIANGYLFTALIVGAWILAFPGVFAPNGLIGGLQSTAWLYVVWHCGFPLFVIGYALLKDPDPGKQVWPGTVGAAIALSVALTVAIVAAAVFVCVAVEPSLPHLMVDPSHFSSLWPFLVGAPIALACISALTVLWIRRRSILDLWLTVVMCLYLLEIPLSYYPVPVRFSVGWYTVRITALLSSSIILTLLLYEITTLYSRLLAAVLAQRREREARLITGDAVAASIAHEIRQPLTAMITSADAGARFLDRSIPNLDRAKEAFKRISADGHHAGEVIDSIRATFKNEVRNRIPLDVNELIREALALERSALQKCQIQVRAEPTTQLPEVRGDRVQLKQVLLNLITNAVDAMADSEAPRVLSVKSEADARNGIVVSVEDTGTGIDPQDIDRIFNPLFTTKSDGMGMGLSICRSIIEAHHGRLWATRNDGPGMNFKFSLPVLSN